LVDQIQGYDLVIIDEAQRIENIDVSLKLIYDAKIKTKIIVTGSSSFVLADKISEALTGRKREIMMYPLSIQELVNSGSDKLEIKSNLENILIYGLYPNVWGQNVVNARLNIDEISNSYLFKDIFYYETLRNPKLLSELLRALALQLGGEVSFNELSRLLSVDTNTIIRYLWLMEQAFIIFPLRSISRNPRTEIRRGQKYYFYDLGLRNSLIKAFKPLDLREDVGALWENFCILERRKTLSYLQKPFEHYFWRTYSQQEIDLVEEIDAGIQAFEFKYNPKKQAKMSESFNKTYKPIKFEIINSDNFWRLTE
jgi:predicted AAA+ superfamily ATPase